MSAFLVGLDDVEKEHEDLSVVVEHISGPNLAEHFSYRTLQEWFRLERVGLRTFPPNFREMMMGGEIYRIPKQTIYQHFDPGNSSIIYHKLSTPL